jgi:hypothetical protein
MDARTQVGAPRTDSVRHAGIVRRLTTETKQAFKDHPGLGHGRRHRGDPVSAAAINGGDTGGTEECIARQAWLYVAIAAGGTTTRSCRPRRDPAASSSGGASASVRFT